LLQGFGYMTMIGAIIQARMGSTRLPGKVMLEVAGKPFIAHLLERLSYTKTLQQVAVATSTSPGDDVIASYVTSLGVPVFRGSEHDVLDRYFQAAQHFELDWIVRVTADCPLIDPALIDEWVRFGIEHPDQYDLITNRHPLTYPDGLDFDIMPINSLGYVNEHATEPHQREHTIPYFWEAGMRVYNFEMPERLFYKHRWTLDYLADYTLLKQIIEALYEPGEYFTTQAILDYLAAHPELQAINAQYIPIEP
jgi:spore coat polysaccharide biosynthesis protein SpsF